MARGEVFVVDPASGKTRRITTTPEHESNVSFNPDGSRLLCISHRDGNWDAFETTIATPEAKSFLVPGPLEETKLIATDTDVLSPAYSPDGKLVAFEEDYSRIRVLNRETIETTTAVKDGNLYSYKVDDLRLYRVARALLRPRLRGARNAHRGLLEDRSGGEGEQRVAARSLLEEHPEAAVSRSLN